MLHLPLKSSLIQVLTLVHCPGLMAMLVWKLDSMSPSSLTLKDQSLHVQSTRMAKVIFGDVVIKERFIVTDVSISILVLGHLVRLDVFSDGIEVKRLRGINVLMDLDANSNVDMKSLSTRFVRTWRDKV